MSFKKHVTGIAFTTISAVSAMELPQDNDNNNNTTHNPPAQIGSTSNVVVPAAPVTPTEDEITLYMIRDGFTEAAMCNTALRRDVAETLMLKPYQYEEVVGVPLGFWLSTEGANTHCGEEAPIFLSPKPVARELFTGSYAVSAVSALPNVSSFSLASPIGLPSPVSAVSSLGLDTIAAQGLSTKELKAYTLYDDEDPELSRAIELSLMCNNDNSNPQKNGKQESNNNNA